LVALIALVATTCLATCSKAPETDEALMKVGLGALYTRKDANAAATVFRKVLERNPTHYGATYQLATALDRAGKPDEARPLWEKVLTTAEATRDTDTAGTARAHLGKVEVVSDEALMKAGLDALYTQKDPNTAVALISTHILGLVMSRYVIRAEPIASLAADDVIELIAPSLQRLLSSD